MMIARFMIIFMGFCTVLMGDNFIPYKSVQKSKEAYPQVFNAPPVTLNKEALIYRLQTDEKEVRQLKTVLAAVKTSLKTVQSDLEAKNTSLALLQGEHQKLQEYIAALSHDYDKQTQKLSLAEERWQTLPQEIQELQKLVLEYKRQNNELSLVGGLKNPQGYRVYELQETLRQLMTQYNELKDEYSAFIRASKTLNYTSTIGMNHVQ